MKRLFTLVFLGCISFCVFFWGGKAISAAEKQPERVVVFYFHGNFRCPTCFNMENYSKEAIEAGFKDALASGRLEFRAVNVEDKGNEHYTNDYQLYTKSLILSFIKDGKELRSKNLIKIWDYAWDKQRFIAYVSGETAAFLKEAR